MRCALSVYAEPWTLQLVPVYAHTLVCRCVMVCVYIYMYVYKKGYTQSFLRAALLELLLVGVDL